MKGKSCYVATFFLSRCRQTGSIIQRPMPGLSDKYLEIAAWKRAFLSCYSPSFLTWRQADCRTE